MSVVEAKSFGFSGIVATIVGGYVGGADDVFVVRPEFNTPWLAAAILRGIEGKNERFSGEFYAERFRIDADGVVSVNAAYAWAEDEEDLAPRTFEPKADTKRYGGRIWVGGRAGLDLLLHYGRIGKTGAYYGPPTTIRCAEDDDSSKFWEYVSFHAGLVIRATPIVIAAEVAKVLRGAF